MTFFVKYNLEVSVNGETRLIEPELAKGSLVCANQRR